MYKFLDGFKVLIINKIMDENSSGLSAWIYNLGLASDGQSQDELLQFFEKTVASVAKRPHRYVTKTISILTQITCLCSLI